MPEILTQITTTKQPARYEYLIQKENINGSYQPDGDADLVISEFDSYFFFDMNTTLAFAGEGVAANASRESGASASEVQNSQTSQTSEVDLTGVGDVFLTFFEGDIQIKIKNLDYIKNIDKSTGQVVFKITTAESKRIRKLSNRYFYVSTKVMVNDAESQESCLFSGFWRAFNESPRKTYRERIADQESTLKAKGLELTALTDTKTKATEELKGIDAEIARLNERKSYFTSQLASLEKELEVAENNANQGNVAIANPNISNAEMNVNPLISLVGIPGTITNPGLTPTQPPTQNPNPYGENYNKALDELLSLGYEENKVKSILKYVINTLGTNLTVDQLVREVEQKLGR